MSESVLDVNHLFWQVDNKTILADIHFSLSKGQMLGLIGPNGAGKSSLLRCLYRYIVPSSGDIEIFSKPISEFSPKSLAQHIAVVQQDTPQYFDITAEQLVTMGLTPHKGLFDPNTAQDRERILSALTKVGLLDKAKQKYEQLSGGEKQRALIARAIVQQPHILILDEPTNHLDIRYQIQILELVASLGISVIASIHDLNLASAMCDKLLLLDRGQLIAKGTPIEVLTQLQISDVFGVCCDINQHPQHGNPLISYFYGYQATPKGCPDHD